MPVNIISKVCFFFGLFSLTFVSYALKEDMHKKIYIEGDYALLNYKTGVHTFTGHVKVAQGTTHVAADKIQTINNTKHKIKEVIAFGENDRAHYWTLPKSGEKEIHALAKIITFFPDTSNATLEKNAIVTQGNNSFQGEKVLYNMDEQTVTVPASKNGKAVLIYDPDSKES